MPRDEPARLVGLFVLAGSVAIFLWLFLRPPAPPPELERPPGPRLVALNFAALAGWADDTLGDALPALRRSCKRLLTQAPERSLGADGLAGTAGDWRLLCERARETAPDGARAFFEQAFVPFAISGPEGADGLFTGYYEPELDGRLAPEGEFQTPLYGRPADLIRVDLGAFRRSLEGQGIVGRIDGQRLVPYDERQAIRTQGLDGRATPLVWLDDPIAAFFIQIQGSGRVRLGDGSILRLGYADKNGRPYFAIGRALIERGALSRESVSLQSIRTWLRDNPAQADAVMDLNASYVFFRKLTGDGPIGAQGVALTPGRSLAVDRRFIPLGVPVWLDASLPATERAPATPLRRLMVAQDTGGAIRGMVRGDVFFGTGQEAEALAGRMKQSGRYYILLPKAIANRHRPSS